MFENEIAVNRFLRGYLHNVLADFSEADLSTVPAENVNPPVRIVAHLAIAGDFAAAALGGKPTCPPDWGQAYGPGTPATMLPAIPPTRDQALLQVEAAYDQLCSLALVADPAAVARPHSIPWFVKSPIQTVAHSITLMLTGHFAIHLGQISMTRRLRGMPPLF